MEGTSASHEQLTAGDLYNRLESSLLLLRRVQGPLSWQLGSLPGHVPRVGRVGRVLETSETSKPLADGIEPLWPTN